MSIVSIDAASSADKATLASSAQEFLAFKLGKEEYGIHILKVQELRGYEEPTRIANAQMDETTQQNASLVEEAAAAIGTNSDLAGSVIGGLPGLPSPQSMLASRGILQPCICAVIETAAFVPDGIR